MKARTCCSWRSVRFKFIYRPAGLGNRDRRRKLTLTASGSSLAINNPTPFYITVSHISRDGGKPEQ
jgi:chaperone protein EcpD